MGCDCTVEISHAPFHECRLFVYLNRDWCRHVIRLDGGLDSGLDLKWVGATHSLYLPSCFRESHSLILGSMTCVTTGTPDLQVGEAQISEGITVPASSTSLGSWLFRLVHLANNSMLHAEHLEEMLSGRETVVFDLGFFSIVFLFDDRVRRALEGHLLLRGRPRCCGFRRVAVVAVKCAGLNQLFDVRPHLFGGFIAVIDAAIVVFSARMANGIVVLFLLRLYECHAAGRLRLRLVVLLLILRLGCRRANEVGHESFHGQHVPGVLL